GLQEDHRITKSSILAAFPIEQVALGLARGSLVDQESLIGRPVGGHFRKRSAHQQSRFAIPARRFREDVEVSAAVGGIGDLVSRGGPGGGRFDGRIKRELGLDPTIQLVDPNVRVTLADLNGQPAAIRRQRYRAPTLRFADRGESLAGPVVPYQLEPVGRHVAVNEGVVARYLRRGTALGYGERFAGRL